MLVLTSPREREITKREFAKRPYRRVTPLSITKFLGIQLRLCLRLSHDESDAEDDFDLVYLSHAARKGFHKMLSVEKTESIPLLASWEVAKEIARRERRRGNDSIAADGVSRKYYVLCCCYLCIDSL